MKQDDLYQNVEFYILEALMECANKKDYLNLLSANSVSHVAPIIIDDLLSFAKKDPAAKLNPLFILKSYTSFSAVLHYRVAHWIYQYKEKEYIDNLLPALLSKRGKLLSGAEIHFRSQIGNRFILDHGFGTVIGETSVLGDDCYILGGVTLGAKGISQNPDEPRHPIIGDRVQIGSGSSIFGRVKIGNDVFIGSNCIITQNISDGAKVKIQSKIQITYPDALNKESYRLKNTSSCCEYEGIV